MALLNKVSHLWASKVGIQLKNNLNPRKGSKDLNLDYRVKASTLMETLVATVLIVIVFMVSSMILNNLLSGSIRQNTELAEERLHVLEYQYKNKGLELPYYEDFESWEITISKQGSGDKSLVTMEAENPITHAIVTNYITNED